MKFSILHSILLLIIFISPLVVFPQENEADVKLSIEGDKQVFKMDEPILLNLTFSAKGGKYSLATLINDGLSYEEISISPVSGVFDWKNEYKRGRYYMNDHFAYTELSTKPVVISLYLNNYLRFEKPGKYTVNIKTKRVSPFQDRNISNKNQNVLTTNPVSFEILPMSKTEEFQKVQEISEKLKTKLTPKETNDLSNELAFMGGDVATKAKVWHFLNPQQDFNNGYHNLRYGLFISRNRPLIIKLLEDALRDTEREANFDVLSILVDLRVMNEDENLELPNNAGSKQFLEYRKNRANEIEMEYLNEIILSLPLRKGKNKAATAITILDKFHNKKNKAEYTDKLLEIIVGEFDNLYVNHQERILEYYWETIKSPALIPSLEKILDNKDPKNSSYQTRQSALKRLIELDEQKARPYVIEEIKNPQSVIDVEVLGSLKDEFLPETDQYLLEQIREIGQIKVKNRDYVMLRLKALLAARYSTDAIYGELLNIYRSSHQKWFADSKGALIGYFVRHNNKEAVRLIEETLETMDSSYNSTFFSELTKMNYSKEVNSFLLKWLEGDEAEKASLAAYIISRNGGEENKEKILARYNRWLKKWSKRKEEFKVEKPTQEISQQIMFQVNVVEALNLAKSWKLSDKEKAELAKTCFSEMCQRYAEKDKVYQ
ncbi:MAG: hypothetical protein ACR2MD_16930 [Aridibacter sp.]